MKCKVCHKDVASTSRHKQYCEKCYNKNYYKNNKLKLREYQDRHNKTEHGKFILNKEKNSRQKRARRQYAERLKVFDKILNCRVNTQTIYYRKRRVEKIGIQYNQFVEKVKNQKYRCAICGIRFENSYEKLPNLDHCHKTRKIRGILCTKCNLLLGSFADDITMLKKFIKYLRKYS